MLSLREEEILKLCFDFSKYTKVLLSAEECMAKTRKWGSARTRASAGPQLLCEDCSYSCPCFVVLWLFQMVKEKKH